MEQYNARTADKFVFRLPEGMRDALRREAVANQRSMNNQLIYMCSKYLNGEEYIPTTSPERWIPQIGQLVQLRDPFKVSDNVEMGVIIGFVRVRGVFCAKIEFEGSSKVEFEDLNKICPVCISL